MDTSDWNPFEAFEYFAHRAATALALHDPQSTLVGITKDAASKAHAYVRELQEENARLQRRIEAAHEVIRQQAESLGARRDRA